MKDGARSRRFIVQNVAVDIVEKSAIVD